MKDEWKAVKKEALEAELKRLKEAGASITAITGTDTGKSIEVIYHLLAGKRAVNLRVNITRETPQIRTITGTFPGAELYERELSEMLGIKILGHPDPRGLFLPEDWKGKPPYRK